MIFLSILIFILSLVLVNKTKKNLVLFSFFSFVILLLSSIYLVSDYFTGRGVDESVIYQLTYGLEGAGFGAYKFIISIGIILLLTSMLSPLFIYRKLQKYKIHNNVWKNTASFLFLLFAFFINPFTKNILELNGFYLFSINDKLDFSKVYEIPEKQIADKNNKNLIFIYLESFEKLYLDKELFPELAVGLESLKEESTYFNNINEAYGTARTIAGMVGSQCGVPLITSGGGGNSMHGMGEFLAGAFCMGDFLKDAGYDLSYLGGAKLEFAGKGNFYETHGFDSIEGRDELLNSLDDKNYQSDWGLYDDTTFDLLFKKYKELAKQNKKFGLFSLSLDTHGDVGVVSDKCRNLKYTDKQDNSILNSYHCDDYILIDFINKVRNDEDFKNTIIVIASDHYAMSNNNSIDIIKKKEKDRKMLFFVFDPDNTAQKIEKMGTTLDIGATVLGMMGFNIKGLGLGANLLDGDTKTIQERYKGFIFQKWKKYYESFWSYPSIKDGFSLDLENKKILFGEKTIEFPALISLDKSQEIEKVLWYDRDNPTSLYENIPKSSNSIYIDDCKFMDKFKTGICILYTRKDGKIVLDEILNIKFEISKKEVTIDKINSIFR